MKIKKLKKKKKKKCNRIMAADDPGINPLSTMTYDYVISTEVVKKDCDNRLPTGK